MELRICVSAWMFRSGNLGIMDYYRLRNIQADTQMRNSIGGGPGVRPEGDKK